MATEDQLLAEDPLPTDEIAEPQPIVSDSSSSDNGLDLEVAPSIDLGSTISPDAENSGLLESTIPTDFNNSSVLPSNNSSISLDRQIEAELQPSTRIAQSPELVVQYMYNQQLYELEIFLDSGADETDEQRFRVNPSSIIAMSIVDQVDEWNARGYMSFFYVLRSPDLQSIVKTGQTQETNIDGQGVTVLQNYNFRSDGLDVLRFRLSLIADSEAADSVKIEPNDPLWTLNYTFSVIEIEDVVDIPGLKNQGATVIKCLKVYLQDLRAELLQGSNIEYSTKNVPLPTGKVISDMLEQAFKQNAFRLTTTESLRFVSEPEKWDEGASNIIYTSPADRMAFDDIQYVYSNHVSKQSTGSVKDFCLFATERNGAKDNRYFDDFVLKPASQLFNKSTDGRKPGELQLERFYVDSFTREQAVTNVEKVPVGDVGAFDRDFVNAKYGTINTFALAEMSPRTNRKDLNTRPVCSFDFATSTYTIEFANNNVKEMQKAVGELYIKPLFKDSKAEEVDPSLLFLPVIDKSKEVLNVEPVYSPYGGAQYTELRQSAGIQKLLKTGIFLNTCIQFSTLGLPLRQSGTFIAIDKAQGSQIEDDFTNKLFGQWFVIQVEHVFTTSLYVNNIYAVKVHRFTNSQPDFKYRL